MVIPQTAVRATAAPAPTDLATLYRRERMAHWDAVALRSPRAAPGYYHRRLAEIYRFLAPPGARVLELGCGRGDLLAALRPGHGVGVDFSGEMIRQARERHPGLHWVEGDAHDVPLDEPFDVILLSDLVNDIWDIQAVLDQAARLSSPSTRIILNFHSRLWQLPLALARAFGMSQPLLPQNWVTTEDVRNLLHLSGLEVLRHWNEVLCPLRFPGVDRLLNCCLVKTGLFRWAGLTNFVVARPRPRPADYTPSVSVIIPARNEAGNIDEVFERVPEMGRETELIFVEGHSRDDTYEAVERAMAAHPTRPALLLRQTGEGKGDAVRLGFARAKGDILMILDADLTVAPEDLTRVYNALRAGDGEFINCVRLVYPMERGAMRFLNLLGNKFFSTAFTWLLGQPIKDTLCGTKALYRTSYETIAAHRAYFGDFDPFGDFDLLFGAAKLNMKLTDLPVRYRDRRYGATNIHRWKHGLLLLRMVLFAAGRIKFT